MAKYEHGLKILFLKIPKVKKKEYILKSKIEILNICFVYYIYCCLTPVQDSTHFIEATVIRYINVTDFIVIVIDV